MAVNDKLSKLTGELNIAVNERKAIGDTETKLRFEIRELDKTKLSYERQLGCISSSKADAIKSRARYNKSNYTNSSIESSKKIQQKNDDIICINAIIKKLDTDIRKKNELLGATILIGNAKATEIAELSKKYKNEAAEIEKEIKSNRELAIKAGVPSPCLKSILVNRLENGDIEIHFCGIGNKTDIRNKCRIIRRGGNIYRKDIKDSEPILVPRERS